MNIKEYYIKTNSNYDEALARLMNDALILRFVHKLFDAHYDNKIKEAKDNK